MLEKKLEEFIQYNRNDWLKRVGEVNVNVEKEKKVLDIVQRFDKFEIVVNFNMQLFSILKEKTIVERHGPRPSFTIAYKLIDLKLLYPVVRSVYESVRTFNYTSSKL